MKKRLLLFLAVIFSLSLVLVACGGKDDSSSGEDSGSKDTEEKEDGGEGGEGGTLTYAFDQEPEGLFINGFASSIIDSRINDLMHDSLWTVNDSMEYEPGLASWETEDNKVFHFTLEEGVKWHNGEELTMNDWEFALEVLAHPDYDGQYYYMVQEIEGADAYHKGEADSISGVKVEDDYHATITFKDKKINNLENLWADVMPKKNWKVSKWQICLLHQRYVKIQ